jgi:hypothetical protein
VPARRRVLGSCFPLDGHPGQPIILPCEKQSQPLGPSCVGSQPSSSTRLFGFSPAVPGPQTSRTTT